MADDPTARFAALVARKDQPVPLDEALLLIAVHADPTVDITTEQARLDELAAGVDGDTVAALREHLFDELGFARCTSSSVTGSLPPTSASGSRRAASSTSRSSSDR